MVGLTTLFALLLGAVEIRTLMRGRDRRGDAVRGGLAVLLAALMTWQLATEPSGLGRLGWTSVKVEVGRAGQLLVVAMLALLLLAAALPLLASRTGESAIMAKVAASLGLIGAVGSLATAYTCFIE